MAETRSAHAGVANAGRDLAFGQMAVTDQPLVAIFGQDIGMRLEKTRDREFDGLGEQGSGAKPHRLGQHIANSSG